MRYPPLTSLAQLIPWAGALVKQLSADAEELRQTGVATLGAGSTTTVAVAGLRRGDLVFLQPMAVAGVGAWVSAVVGGSFTITHGAAEGARVAWRVG